MVSQLQSDASSLIKCQALQPLNTYAKATDFVLLCSCGWPADYVVYSNVPSKRRPICREVKFG